MQRFARLVDGVVVEIVELPLVAHDLVLGEDGTAQLCEDGEFQYTERPFHLEDVFPVSIAEQMRPCGPEIEQGWLFDGKAFAAPPELPTLPPVEAGPTIIGAATLFDRMTEEESLAIDAAMQKRALKFRGAWNAIIAGSDLRSDHDVWSALKAEIEKLYGDDRTAALLSPV